MPITRMPNIFEYQTYLASYARSTNRKESQTKDTPTIFRSSFRIISNLIASGLVVLSLATVVVLLGAGMFNRRVNINDLTFDATYMKNFGDNCRLSSSGFLSNTCSDSESTIVTAPAWQAMSQVLARQWVADDNAPFYVTTCVKGPSDGWSSLIFLAGYDGFPKCVPPNGSQEIAGMASAETTIREEYPNGAYILTVFADQTMPESVSHLNTDGTIDMIISNYTRSLITIDGVAMNDPDGINTVITSAPLGKHYLITSFSYPTVLDITKRLDSTIPWWNVGRKSKKVVTLSWDTGHTVANANELIALQLAMSLWAIVLFSSDVFLTFQGLQGFLLHKPVMTYDLLAGLERRRLALVVVGLGTMPSLLYADVARIYRGTANGDLIWNLSVVLVGMFFSLLTLIALTLIQKIPSPTRQVFTFSPSMFCYSTILGIAIVWSDNYAQVARKFNSAPFELGLNVSGTYRPAGAYSSEGAVTVVSYLAGPSLAVVGSSMLFSIFYSTFRRVIARGPFLINTAWTKTNSFMDHCALPNWITGLALEQSNAIKIGNKLFCKPSTQAMLGFAVVAKEDKPSDKYKVADMDQSRARTFRDVPLYLISVYQLLPTLCKTYQKIPYSWSPSIFGVIDKNVFTKADSKRLGNDVYIHYRGACVN